MKIHKEGYENYLKWIKETDKYLDVICSESTVKVLLNVNGKRDITELQKISEVKSLKTIYNIRTNLSELHLIEFKKEKPSHSALGIAVKAKILELEQLMKTAEYVRLFSAKQKLRIILFLDDYEKHESEIRNKTDSKSEGTTNHILTHLEYDDKIVVELNSKKREWKLSEKGMHIKDKFIELLKLFLTIKRHKEYLNGHLINIPEHCLPFLHIFYNGKIIKDSFYDNMIVFNTVRRMALTGKYFYGVVSAYAENYIAAVGETVKTGIAVRVIISENVKKCLGNNNGIFEMINAMNKNKNAKLMISGNLDKFTLLLTDKEIALFLFKRNGDVEWYEFLHCKDEGCVHFGDEIFKFYEREAIEI